MPSLEHLIAELVTTEETYINRMSYVVEGYLVELHKKYPKVSVPEDLKDHRNCIVFMNFEEIYRWHKDFFYPALVTHRHCAADLGKLFVSCESQFDMYAKYCVTYTNFDHTEYSEYFAIIRRLLKHKVEIRDFMIAPFQRLARYQHLLLGIAKHLKDLKGDWDSIMEAHNTIMVVNKNVNDCLILHGIKNYDGDIFDHGKLIFHEKLMCMCNYKKILHHVFLFKRLLIFTNEHDPKKKYGAPTYSYKLQIPMNNLQLEELPNKCFKLKSTDPTLQDLNLTCYGETEEIHSQWLEKIQEQLKTQAD